MNRKKIIPIAAIAVILAAALIYFEFLRDYFRDDDRLSGTGTIEVTEIDISTKISGRIVSLPRDEGDSFEKNDLLIKIEYDELMAQKLSVVANLKNAEKNLERVQSLYKSGSVSKKDYDNSLTAYRVAKARYDQIRATIENAVILAPISGTVLEKNLETGEMAFPGSPILTIADLENAWIKIYVTEKNLGLVKLGQKALVFIDTYPDRPFPGKVVSIANRAEFTPKTIQTKEERVKLMYAVKISLDNPEQILKAGMPADAEILIEE